MAGLAPKRGLAHPWWALAEAMVVLLESEHTDAIALVTETFERRAGK